MTKKMFIYGFPGTGKSTFVAQAAEASLRLKRFLYCLDHDMLLLAMNAYILNAEVFEASADSPSLSKLISDKHNFISSISGLDIPEKLMEQKSYNAIVATSTFGFCQPNYYFIPENEEIMLSMIKRRSPVLASSYWRKKYYVALEHIKDAPPERVIWMSDASVISEYFALSENELSGVFPVLRSLV